MEFYEQGVVARLTDRGFGFIRPDAGGDDIFLHANGLVGVAFGQLLVGTRVEFGRELDSTGRLRAVAVRLVEQQQGEHDDAGW